ncbi:MAG: gamma-glutamyltransferase family protein [Pseudomonadota bacterium]
MSIPRDRDFHLPGRSAVFAANGLAATSHPLGAKVAVEMLEAGGNAVDAAVAGAVVLGLCEPQMTGLGGDMFALVEKEGEEIVGLNASGRAPAALTAAMLRDAGHDKMPKGTAHAVTIPTAVDGFDKLLHRFGTRDFETVLAPALRYAEEGVPVAPRVAFDWAQSVGALQGRARELFAFDGAAPVPGRIFRAPGQAEALRRISRDGRRGFYEGEVAEDMVASLRALGGVHELSDFASAEADWVEPIQGDYRGVELVELPPNGHGATAILMNNILETFDIASMDPFGVERAHVETEAAKLAYDARNRFIADPDHCALRLAHMLSKDTGKALAKLIDPDTAMADPRKISEQVHRETIYITVVDRDLMKVSLIYSIFSSFGSGLASEKFGILFQDRGMGFTLEQGHPNEAAGGKRPLHTIIPGMMRENGLTTRVFGVMGGAYQPHGHARVMSNLYDFGMEPQAALDAPRVFHDGPTDQMRVERGHAAGVLEGLAAKGHPAMVPATAIGGAQMITVDRKAGVLIGASDPRKDGIALGY